jgi:hypothetical protein
MSMSSIPIEYRFDNFDVKAVKILNEILEETDAEIVVSSDWQNFATLDELGEYYESQGIIKKPIGVTKEIGDVDFEKYDKMPWNRDLDLEQHRSLEILEWLEAHAEVTHWVAVDDLHMGIMLRTAGAALMTVRIGVLKTLFGLHVIIKVSNKVELKIKY